MVIKHIDCDEMKASITSAYWIGFRIGSVFRKP